MPMRPESFVRIPESEYTRRMSAEFERGKASVNSATTPASPAAPPSADARIAANYDEMIGKAEAAGLPDTVAKLRAEKASKMQGFAATPSNSADTPVSPGASGNFGAEAHRIAFKIRDYIDKERANGRKVWHAQAAHELRQRGEI